MAGAKPLIGVALGGGCITYAYYASQQLYFLEGGAIDQSQVHWSMIAFHEQLGRQGTVTLVGGIGLFIIVVCVVAMLRISKR